MEVVILQSQLDDNLRFEAQRGPGRRVNNKLRVGIVGSGLAGMVTAMDLSDAGHEVILYRIQVGDSNCS